MTESNRFRNFPLPEAREDFAEPAGVLVIQHQLHGFRNPPARRVDHDAERRASHDSCRAVREAGDFQRRGARPVHVSQQHVALPPYLQFFREERCHHGDDQQCADAEPEALHEPAAIERSRRSHVCCECRCFSRHLLQQRQGCFACPLRLAPGPFHRRQQSVAELRKRLLQCQRDIRVAEPAGDGPQEPPPAGDTDYHQRQCAEHPSRPQLQPQPPVQRPHAKRYRHAHRAETRQPAERQMQAHEAAQRSEKMVDGGVHHENLRRKGAEDAEGLRLCGENRRSLFMRDSSISLSPIL